MFFNSALTKMNIMQNTFYTNWYDVTELNKNQHQVTEPNIGTVGAAPGLCSIASVPIVLHL